MIKQSPCDLQKALLADHVLVHAVLTCRITSDAAATACYRQAKPEKQSALLAYSRSQRAGICEIPTSANRQPRRVRSWHGTEAKRQVIPRTLAAGLRQKVLPALLVSEVVPFLSSGLGFVRERRPARLHLRPLAPELLRFTQKLKAQHWALDQPAKADWQWNF